MAILETKNLSKAFGALAAVDGVSLRIEAGTLHSIIGPNGAGKTTLFNLLTGTTAPSSGRILLDGRDITGTPAHRAAHLGLAFVVVVMFFRGGVVEAWHRLALKINAFRN